MRKLISHAKRSPRPIEQIPPGLSRILDRMMAKDPECRYQTPAEVAGALRPYLPGMPPPRRKPRRGIASLLGFAAAALLLFGIVTYRIKTDRGELIIEAQDDAVEVVVSKGGRVVKILDTKTDKQITLDSGDYDLKLKDDADGLKLSLDKVTLKRGERVLATIWREAKVAAKPPETNWNVKGEPVITTIPATWTTADDPEVRQLAGPQITRLLFSPDGKRALGAARDDNRVMVWDVETGRKLPPLVMPRSGLYSLAISRNGRRIVTGGVDGVQIWDAETGKEIASFKQGTGTAVTFSPDGKLILAGILDDAQRLGSIRVLEVETGKLLRVIDGDAIVVSLAISPDGKRALAFEGGQQVVKLLELETGKLVRAFGGDGMNKRTFATFSPDGRRGLTFSTQGAQVWDIESGKELLKIAAQAAVFTPDGRHLLTARSDGIYVTQIVRPEATVVVKKMDLKSATLIALSSDGQRVLTANASGVVQLYTLPGLVQLHTLPDQSIQK